MNPGPDSDHVLSLQDSHRSTAIWNGEEYDPFTIKNHLKTLSSFPVPTPVTNFLTNTQFSGIQRLCFVPLDHDLITALVERWRQETHTFHLPFGEVTVTLQDVAVLFGLRIRGRPVTGTNNYRWPDLCQSLLGRTPTDADCRRSKLKLTWLHQNFQNLGEDPSAYDLHCHVRAYLLYLIGAVLFPDKSGNTVSLIYLPLLANLEEVDDISWGSAVLACLYRNLCKACKQYVYQLAGPVLLLQLWSWERISISRPVNIKSHIDREEGVFYPLGPQLRVGLDPLGCKWLRVDRFYKDHRLGVVIVRGLLDRMAELEFVWQPYTPDVLQHLSPICSEYPEEWTVIAPLICFEMVEWHFPERCMRQFGWNQNIPPLCNTCVDLHNVTRQGDAITDYAKKHQVWIDLWNNRLEKRVQPGSWYSGLMSYTDEYYQWYHSITKRQISPLSSMVYDDYANHHYYYPTATDYQRLTDANRFTYNTTTNIITNMPDDVPVMEYNLIDRMRQMSLGALKDTRQQHLLLPQDRDHEEDDEEQGQGQRQGQEEEEEQEQEQDRRPSFPLRYNFRHLEHREQYSTQESDQGESSSRQRKKGKNRRDH